MKPFNVQTVIYTLAPHIPEQAIAPIQYYISKYKISVKLKRNRITKLGDYRAPVRKEHHEITINANMNPYAFLVTLIHEIAHAITWEKYGNKVSAHGKEWKSIYATILNYFVKKEVFPENITNALNLHIQNPPSSSSLDEKLSRALRKYDKRSEKLTFVGDLQVGDKFKTAAGKIFIIQKKVRKRYVCKDMNSNSMYLFSPVAEVFPINSDV